MTLEEIGGMFNLTRERVRQIKERSLRRLTKATGSKELKSYLA
jgi:RNA polymerase primary sigma factor